MATPPATPAPEGDRSSPTLTPEESRAVERRIGELKARGGDCAVYGSVLERSYNAGLIKVTPYMWRVGPHLAAAQALRDGQMTLARDVDSLNIGVRRLADLIWSLEHEAAHIAFDIRGDGPDTDRANEFVRACQESAAGRNPLMSSGRIMSGDALSQTPRGDPSRTRSRNAPRVASSPADGGSQGHRSA